MSLIRPRRLLPWFGTLALAAGVTAAHAATIPVVNTNVSGPGSLEQAILDSNASVGTTDTIVFNIPAAGVQVIAPKTPLPAITDSVIIDGYTQPGAFPNTLAFGDNAVILIEVDGFQAGTVTALFDVQTGGTTIRGLSIVNAQGGDGIFFETGAGGTAVGNFVGVKPDGITGAGNGCAGLRSGVPGTVVGSALPADRNVISGAVGCGINLIFQAVSGIAKGNYIGTNAAGTFEVGGAVGVDLTGSGHQIGGTGAGEGNVISGNNNGIRIRDGSTGNLVQGNRIGTNPQGDVSNANHNCGVVIDDSSANTIGGAAPGARNVLSSSVCGISIGGLLANANLVLGNYIGTNAAGDSALQNGVGIYAGGTGTRIGGTAPGEGNLISGNIAEGIGVTQASGLVITGNRIGTDASGTAPLPNQIGVRGYFGPHDGIVGGPSPGDGNTIAFNSVAGISIDAGTFVLEGNSIHSNGFGIDLSGDGVTPNDPGDSDSGPNGLQNYPVLTSAAASPASVRIQGTLNSLASQTYRVEFFSSPSCDGSGFGEGRVFLGSTDVMTDGAFSAVIDATLPAQVAAGSAITATATTPGGTSEFSACVTAAPAALTYFTLPPCRVVDTRNPNGPLGGPALAANADRTFVVRGICGVPASALAVSLNVAVTLETRGGDLRIFPAGTLLPLVSAINYNAFKTRSDDAVIGLGANGDVTVHVDQPTGTVHLILDVDGYFQ